MPIKRFFLLLYYFSRLYTQPIYFERPANTSNCGKIHTWPFIGNAMHSNTLSCLVVCCRTGALSYCIECHVHQRDLSCGLTVPIHCRQWNRAYPSSSCTTFYRFHCGLHRLLLHEVASRNEISTANCTDVQLWSHPEVVQFQSCTGVNGGLKRIWIVFVVALGLFDLFFKLPS